jgi:hypothetical protein
MLSLIVFSGLLFGILLAYISPEELDGGKKYFEIFSLLVLFGIFLVLIHYFKFSVIGLVLGVISGYFLKRVYFYFGLGLVLSHVLGFNLLFSSLVFIFGLPYGSLLVIKSKKLWKEIVIDFVLFLIPFLLLIVKFDYTKILSSFLAGAFLVLLVKNAIHQKDY